MTGTDRRARIARPQRFVLWLLLLALPVGGLASVLAQVLGSSHRHRPAATASALDGWQDFRRMAGAGPSARQAHSHRFWQRHHHVPVDASVVTLDAGVQESTPAGEAISSAAVSAGLCSSQWGMGDIGKQAASLSGWRKQRACRVESVAAEPPERPPKAG